MKFRTAFAALTLAVAGLGAPVVGALSPADGATHVVARHHHHCTRTSSGSCIRGGEFCPRADYGRSGYDAHGRRYVCKGSHSHPTGNGPDDLGEQSGRLTG